MTLIIKMLAWQMILMNVWKNPAGFEDVYGKFADQLTVENTFF